jgi:translation elongation factor P/translation initiation factor 5A
MKKGSKTVVLAGVLAVAVLMAFGQLALAEEKKPAAEPGAIAVSVLKASATVEAVDAAKRTVTLKGEAGQTKTLKCGPEVRNFDQIKVGDKVNLTFVDEVAAYVRKADAPPMAEESAMVALAPKGAKPGALMAETVEVKAKIESVNTKKHTITFLNPDGSKKTVKVGKKAKELKELQKGDDVVLRITQAMMIDVKAPAKK